jgi:hypothetical protein
MKSLQMRSALSLTVLFTALLTGVSLFTSSPLTPSIAVGHAASVAAGAGFMGVLGCIGCAAGFVVGAGTTVAGMAVFIAANPEIAIMCVSACSLAT